MSRRWGRRTSTLTITIGLIFAPLIGRTVRTAVLQERELDYVTAARLRGERGVYIMFAEILPNVMAPVMVEFTVRLGYAIFTVATLSFLDFGIQLPTPDWGLTSPRTSRRSPPATGGRCCSRRSRSRPW